MHFFKFLFSSVHHLHRWEMIVSERNEMMIKINKQCSSISISASKIYNEHDDDSGDGEGSEMKS